MVKEQSKSQNAVDLYDPTGEKGIPLIMRRAERISNRSYPHTQKPGSPQTARFFAIPLILP